MDSAQEENGSWPANVVLIHITDKKSGRNWALPKRALLELKQFRPLLKDIHARPQDFDVECGCKACDRATLYVRCTHGRYQICNLVTRDQDWNHDLGCPYWSEGFPIPPTESLSRSPRSDCLRRFFHVQEIGGNEPEKIFSGNWPTSKRNRQRVMGPNSLAAAILALIDFAGLNRYSPNQDLSIPRSRVLQNAIRQLSEVASIKENTPEVVGRDLSIPKSCLPFSNSKSNFGVKPKLVLGSVIGWEEAGDRCAVFLNGFEDRIYIKKASWDYGKSRSPSRHTSKALKRLDGMSANSRVLGLFELTRNEFDQVIAHRVGLCTTTRELIPVESSYELEMTNHLIQEKRTFIKDIYVPEGHRFRHDLRLLDTDREFLIEVHGMDTKKYNEGKRQVEEHLVSDHQGFYAIWMAAKGHAMPAIPPKKGEDQ